MKTYGRAVGDPDAELRLIEEAWNNVQEHYVDAENLDSQALAYGAIRGLIERVSVHETAEGIRIELEGAITALIDLAQGVTTKSPLCSGLDVGSVKVVAGAGFEPAAFRL